MDLTFVIDFNNTTLLKFDKTGNLLKSVGQKGSGKGEFIQPVGVTVVGDEVIICDSGNSRLQVFTSDLVFVRQIGSPGWGNGQLENPFDVTHDQDGNLYVTDRLNHCIQVFNTQGKFLRFLVGPGRINKPHGITFNRDLIYISQWGGNGKIYIYHKNGDAISTIPCKSGKYGLCGVAVDQDGFIYVCDLDQCHVIVL